MFPRLDCNSLIDKTWLRQSLRHKSDYNGYVYLWLLNNHLYPSVNGVLWREGIRRLAHRLKRPSGKQFEQQVFPAKLRSPSRRAP